MRRLLPYSELDVIRKIQDEVGDSVSKDDIKNVINAFWAAIAKYLRGYKSFSVNKMFFFKVHPNKLSSHLEKKRKAYNKSMRKYAKKARRKKRMEKKRKMFQ